MVSQSICFSFIIGLIILLPIGLYQARRRMRSASLFIVREAYQREADGRLQTDHATLDPTSRNIHFRAGGAEQIISFDRVQSLYIQVRTSRKIYLGLVLSPQANESPQQEETWLDLSSVTNHDLRQAGINGHLLAETIAGAGEDFLQAFRAHLWPRILIGATFSYHFDRSPSSPEQTKPTI